MPGLPFRLNAVRVARVVDADRTRPRGSGVTGWVNVPVPPYEGGNAHVLRMRDYLTRRLTPDLLGGYVYGSLATGEEIGYSDFDALVILRDEVFENPRRLARVARELDRARSIMLDFDPLQHHGWFVLAEHELADYPEHRFPVALFRHARALVPADGHTLSIRPRQNRDRTREAFNRMTRAVLRSIATEGFPKNTYHLKVLLSQVMLLPALYVQLRDQGGVFKKHSFDMARRDISPEVWEVMDQVSAIRADWSVTFSPLRRYFTKVRTPLGRRLMKRWAPPIPRALAQQLDHAFCGRLERLVSAMRRRLLD